MKWMTNISGWKKFKKGTSVNFEENVRSLNIADLSTVAISLQLAPASAFMEAVSFVEAMFIALRNHCYQMRFIILMKNHYRKWNHFREGRSRCLINKSMLDRLYQNAVIHYLQKKLIISSIHSITHCYSFLYENHKNIHRSVIKNGCPATRP